jgi:hypothetical protein
MTNSMTNSMINTPNNEITGIMNNEMKIYDTPDFDQFILDHPYPKFKSIRKKLSFRLDLFYDESLHVFCEKIYVNFNNHTLVYQTLCLILDHAGMQSVVACLDVIKDYSPFENYDVTERFVNIFQDFISRG